MEMQKRMLAFENAPIGIVISEERVIRACNHLLDLIDPCLLLTP